jgi:hypothetical protein
VAVLIILFWIVFLGIQVGISVHLIRNKPPRNLSGRGFFYRLAAIVTGFFPVPVMALAAQLVWFALFRNQMRGLQVRSGAAEGTDEGEQADEFRAPHV